MPLFGFRRPPWTTSALDLVAGGRRTTRSSRLPSSRRMRSPGRHVSGQRVVGGGDPLRGALDRLVGRDGDPRARLQLDRPPPLSRPVRILGPERSWRIAIGPPDALRRSRAPLRMTSRCCGVVAVGEVEPDDVHARPRPAAPGRRGRARRGRWWRRSWCGACGRVADPRCVDTPRTGGIIPGYEDLAPRRGRAPRRLPAARFRAGRRRCSPARSRTRDDGLSLPGATVAIEALNLTATTDGEGRYTLTLPADAAGQTYEVKVTAAGLVPRTWTFRPEAGTVTPELRAGPDLPGGDHGRARAPWAWRRRRRCRWTS